jgi:hypothetical protein
MAIRIADDTMTLEIDNCVVATARFSEHRSRRQRRVDRHDLSRSIFGCGKRSGH